MILPQRPIPILLPAILILGLSACRATVPAAPQVAGPGVTVTVPPPPGPSSPSAIARAREDSARYPYTAADVEFMTGMIAHHAQAIVMANMAPARGASPEILRLAARIGVGQVDEIVIMQRWLADRGLPVPDARPGSGGHGAGPGAGHDHHAGHEGMPGMLSPAQIEQLEQARGRRFDELFLRFMIQHHEGAVGMVSKLFATHGAGQDEAVFRFATDVNVDQITEISRMRLMLAELMVNAPPKS
jgi:uncharacterized protein (DUF305 family)